MTIDTVKARYAVVCHSTDLAWDEYKKVEEKRKTEKHNAWFALNMEKERLGIIVSSMIANPPLKIRKLSSMIANPPLKVRRLCSTHYESWNPVVLHQLNVRGTIEC